MVETAIVIVVALAIVFGVCAYMIKTAPIDNTLSFVDAIRVMQRGYKVKHETFTRQLWIKHMNEDLYVDSNGEVCNEGDLWYIYRDRQYERGWEIL